LAIEGVFNPCSRFRPVINKSLYGVSHFLRDFAMMSSDAPLADRSDALFVAVMTANNVEITSYDTLVSNALTIAAHRNQQ
jgi:hypothetical protein